MKGFEVLCEHPAVCGFIFVVVPTVFWKLFFPIASVVREVAVSWVKKFVEAFYPDGFAWSGEGWGAAWGMGACCVSAVSGRTRAGMVFGVAHCVFNPTTRITHKNY